MSDRNRQTISAYEATIQRYISNSPAEVSRTSREWLDAGIKDLPLNARILEIGSGFGHDADYIESLGFVVERTDATEGFVELLRERGHSAKKLNAITDSIEPGYDFIFADSVYHHLDTEEAAKVTNKIFMALKNLGRIAISLRTELAEGWSTEKLDIPRYFTRWDRETITRLLTDVGFGDVTITDADRDDTGWAHLVAIKS